MQFLHKKLITSFLLIVLLSFQAAHAKTDEKKSLNIIKEITIKSIPYGAKIHDIESHGNNFFLLILNEKKVSILKIDSTGAVAKIFKGAGLDGLLFPTCFFVNDENFEIVDYNINEEKSFFFVLNRSLEVLLKNTFKNADYTIAKKLGESIFYYYCESFDKKYVIYSIAELNDNMHIASFRKKLQKPPSRKIIYFFEVAPNKIFSCFDDEYRIVALDTKDNKTSIFRHPTFKNKLYTKNELEILPPMLSYLYKTYKRLPPVIEDILVVGNDDLIVFRKRRPGQRFITLDQFSIEGKFKNTAKLEIHTNEKPLQIFRFKDMIGLLSKVESKYIIRIIEF